MRSRRGRPDLRLQHMPDRDRMARGNRHQDGRSRSQGGPRTFDSPMPGANSRGASSSAQSGHNPHRRRSAAEGPADYQTTGARAERTVEGDDRDTEAAGGSRPGSCRGRHRREGGCFPCGRRAYDADGAVVGLGQARLASGKAHPRRLHRPDLPPGRRRDGRRVHFPEPPRFNPVASLLGGDARRMPAHSAPHAPAARRRMPDPVHDRQPERHQHRRHRRPGHHPQHRGRRAAVHSPRPHRGYGQCRGRPRAAAGRGPGLGDGRGRSHPSGRRHGPGPGLAPPRAGQAAQAAPNLDRRPLRVDLRRRPRRHSAVHLRPAADAPRRAATDGLALVGPRHQGMPGYRAAL